MNFLGIGPLELVFILIFALIIFGPEDLAKAGRTVGRMLNKLVRSPEWRTLQKTGREISTLPNRLMREANLEEITEEINTLPNKLMQEANLEEITKEIGSIGDPLASPPSKGVSGSTDLEPWTTPPDDRPRPATKPPVTTNPPDSSDTPS